MKRISYEELVRLQELAHRDPPEALKLLSSYEKEYSSDENFQHNHGACLIDIGSALRDSAVIQRGVDVIREEKESSGSLSPIQWYNLGNGYYALENVKRGPGNVYDPVGTPMAQAKQCYREALRLGENEPLDWQAQLHVNYGNSLHELGRVVEAVAEFNRALQIVPDFPMALGALSSMLLEYANLTFQAGLLEDALELADQALRENRLEQAGYGHVRQEFAGAKAAIEKRLSEVGRVSRKKHKMPQIISQYHQAYVDFCLEHELFLNLCLKGRHCGHPYEDNISFSLVTPIGEDALAHKLVRTINEIKERYAAARLLLFEACDSPYKTQFYDTITPYIDILDASIYGIRAAKLKLAFEAAYNVLDKIAFFLNDYLALGVKEERVNFTSIWKEQKSTTLRDPIMRMQNRLLFGLYDISTDLTKDGYLAHNKNTRNKLTHRYLVLHPVDYGDWEWHESSDGQDYHLSYRGLLDSTTPLMHLVRNAVIYLVAFVDYQERLRAQKDAGVYDGLGYDIHESAFGGPLDV